VDGRPFFDVAKTASSMPRIGSAAWFWLRGRHIYLVTVEESLKGRDPGAEKLGHRLGMGQIVNEYGWQL